MNSKGPWRVVLTGGIASGKSTVAALFAELGVPVIDVDDVAREVVEPGTPLLGRVLARFGPGVRAADGSLDRRALRKVVFHDAAARRELEAMLHPAIQARTEQHLAGAGGAYQLVVVPLLAETGGASRYDRVLVVDCDEALQRARLAQRDGSNPALIEAVLAAQASRAARLRIATDVIHNDGSAEAMRPQVRQLHAQYLHLASRR